MQERLGAVDETVRGYTGKPLGQWTADLMGAALMIGFAFGKFVRR